MKTPLLTILFTAFCLADEKPYNPTPDREFDVHHTKIDITVDVRGESVEGKVTHTLSPLRTDLSRIRLNSEHTTVSNVSMNGSPLSFEPQEKYLEIDLGSAFGFEDTLSITIAYRAEPKLGLYFIHPDSVYPEKHLQAWTQGEDTDNHYWVPIHDYPNERATFETILTVDKDLTAVSNGELLSVKSNGAQKTFHWRENFPMVSYLISFAIGDYKQVKDQYGDLPVNYWVYPEHSKEDALRSFGNTPAMVALFDSLTGFPYPYEKYDQVLIEDFMWGGMENITLSHQTDRTMHTERARPDHSSDGLVAHELAHQWYGDLLTTRNWANAWLNEGLTSFMTLMWFSHHKGFDSGEYARLRSLKSVIWSNNYHSRPMVLYHYDNSWEVFDANIYAKGAIVMSMLKAYLGEEAFWRGMRHYTAKYAYENVETQDLKKAFEEATGQNLYWFFDQWAYTKGLPKLEVKSKYSRRNNTVSMTVTQTQNIEETSLFKLPVTIVIDDGEITHHSIFIEEAKQTFTFPSNGKPNMIIFDEGNVIPKYLTHKKTMHDLVYQLKHAPHVNDRIWAAEELGKMSARKPVVEALLESVNTDPFFGVRLSAANALGKLKPKKIEQRLMDSVKDQDNRVKRAVVRALKHYPGDDVRDFLTDILENGKKDYLLNDAFNALSDVDTAAFNARINWALNFDSYRDMLRRSAIRAVAKKKSDAALDQLKDLAEYGGTTWSARTSAVWALSEKVKANPQLLDWFVDHVDDPNRDVRSASIRTVGRHGSRKHVAFLEGLYDPINEDTIEEAIENLKKPPNSRKSRRGH
ncbi:MAG: M1 family aminopeptidase [Candidatus Marinimicrobia bacterium]|jgi:aminopeptidase N|nr:M1 family aminopeptidase [Candidatus Neomarinimicrobiota bacterium]MDP7071971.1 M1 family aminopeptidase [Candidatus Neomarinimicrobiota bacterium]